MNPWHAARMGRVLESSGTWYLAMPGDDSVWMTQYDYIGLGEVLGGAILLVPLLGSHDARPSASQPCGCFFGASPCACRRTSRGRRRRGSTSTSRGCSAASAAATTTRPSPPSARPVRLRAVPAHRRRLASRIAWLPARAYKLSFGSQRGPACGLCFVAISVPSELDGSLRQ